MITLPKEFLEKKLLVFTGKGGTGKSNLAAAVAQHISVSMKKRVWILEIGRKRDLAFSRLPQILGVDTLQHKPTQIGSNENLFGCILDPVHCLSEYVDLKIPTAGFAGMLLNNRVTASLLEVVPGLPDLVALGKIYYALQHPENKMGPNVIVLDAPATGHAKALLEAPKNFRKITKKGPIYKDAVQMEEFLANEKNLGCLLACMPEEMVIEETREFHKYLSEHFQTPLVVMNKCFPPVPALKESELPAYLHALYHYSESRHSREKAALKVAPFPFHTMPFFFPDPEQDSLFLRMAEEFS